MIHFKRKAVMLIGFTKGESLGLTVSDIGESQENSMGPTERWSSQSVWILTKLYIWCNPCMNYVIMCVWWCVLQLVCWHGCNKLNGFLMWYEHDILCISWKKHSSELFGSYHVTSQFQHRLVQGSVYLVK